jgi:hypothetical protein
MIKLTVMRPLRAVIYGFLFIGCVVSTTKPAHAQALKTQCPPIPGYAPVRGGGCSCPPNQVITASPQGSLACSPTKPTSWRLPSDPKYGPPRTCPYPLGASAHGDNCGKYCESCLLEHYGSDIWADIWAALDVVIAQLGGKSSWPGLHSCAMDILGILIPIANAARNEPLLPLLISNLRPDQLSNLLTQMCARNSCFKNLSATPAGKHPVFKGLLLASQLACSGANHVAHAFRCQALRLECETDLSGGLPIPRCNNIGDNPVWGQTPIQWRENACLDCCLAQTIDAYTHCAGSRYTEQCQGILNRCLKTCRRRSPPSPPTIEPPTARPSACPIMQSQFFCRNCPSGKCEKQMSPECFVDASLDDTGSCKKWFSTYEPNTLECNQLFCAG